MIAAAMPLTAAMPLAGAAAAPENLIIGFEPGRFDPLLADAIAAAGGRVTKVGLDVGIAVVEGPAGLLQILAGNPLVDFAETNDQTRAEGATWNGATWNGATWNGATWNGATWNGPVVEWSSEPGASDQWGLQRIRAPSAWNTTTGGGAAICVVDTGIDAHHPDVEPNLHRNASGAIGWNAITGTSDVADDAGHGTHVAGAAAAAVGNSFGVAGVGNAPIMTVKALDANGSGTEADVALGITWCADNGARVILLALSTSEPSAGLDRSIKYAAELDVVLVASAGNVGPCSDCIAYPASNPRVVAVGALQPDDTIAPFSASGSKLAFAAPGVDVVSTFPGDAFAFGSGTSQAAAIVAGTAALVRSTNESLSAKATRDVLATTAEDLGPSGRDATFGHGVPDVARAVEVAFVPPTSTTDTSTNTTEDTTTESSGTLTLTADSTDDTTSG